MAESVTSLQEHKRDLESLHTLWWMHGFSREADDIGCWEAHHRAEVLTSGMASTGDLPGLSQPTLQAIPEDCCLRRALWQLLPRAVQLGAGSSPETGPRPVQPEAMHNSRSNAQQQPCGKYQQMGENTRQAWTLTGPVQ